MSPRGDKSVIKKLPEEFVSTSRQMGMEKLSKEFVSLRTQIGKYDLLLWGSTPPHRSVSTSNVINAHISRNKIIEPTLDELVDYFDGDEGFSKNTLRNYITKYGYMIDKNDKKIKPVNGE